jgi:beta-mannosidase
MRFTAKTATLLASSIPATLGLYVQELSNVKWILSSEALNRTVPGYLPSQAHLDLLKAGVIGEWHHIHLK